MPRFISTDRSLEQPPFGPDEASREREVRLLKPMPVRSYTVILIGLLAFTVALVIFLLTHSE